MKTVTIPDLYLGKYEVSQSNRDYILAKGASMSNGDQQYGFVESNAFSGNLFHINGMVNNGHIYGAGMALSGLGSELTIGRFGGVVGGQVAVLLLGTGQSLLNHGTISSSVYAISATVAGFDITSDGTITSGTGIYATAEGTITNNGAIDGGVAGIKWSNGAGLLMLGETSDIQSESMGEGYGIAVNRINGVGIASTTINNGNLMGTNFSFLSDAGNERFVNNGTMTGDVGLGAGDDVFDSRKGTITGSVTGGAGGDTYYFGATAFNILENGNDAGTDILYSAKSTQLQFLWDIEELHLTGKKAASANGTTGAEEIFGNKGNNFLAGYGGHDELTGGAGKDVFVFRTDFDTDSIMDFKNGTDKIDLSGWDSVSSFADIQAKNFLFFVDGNTIISDGMGEELTIVGFDIAKLDKSDFSF